MSIINRLGFRRSTFCGTGSCVEVALLNNGDIALRDSKNPAVPAHQFTSDEWTAFIRGVRAGEFDVSALTHSNGVETTTAHI